MLKYFLSILVAFSCFAEIKVGVILPLTGDFARYGQKVQAAIESVKDPDVKFIYDDEGCKGRKALTAYKKLTEVDGVDYFLGPYCGSPQVTVAPFLKNKRIAVLGASAPRRVFKLSGNRMFSTQHSIEQESIFNAKKAYEMGHRKAVIVFFENDFSRAHEKAFRDTFQGEILETLTYNAIDASALKALAIKIKKLDPDLVYVPDAAPLMHGFIKELHTIGLKDKRVFSVYSAESKDVLDALGAFGEGLVYSYPDIGEKEALKYFPQIATKMLLKAIKGCKEQGQECVLESLEKDNNFDEFGVLEGNLILKTIRQGSFSEL